MDSMSSVFPRFAVLLAAYNGMEWIEEQLDSILNQINVSVAVFISVDPSTDGTESFCSAYAGQHSNITLLPGIGRFGGASRNFFRLIRDVDFSSFDYVAFSDQDDLWHSDKLHRATSVLALGIFEGYSSNVIAFWPDGRKMLLDKAQPQVRWDYLFEAAGPGCTYVISRPLADAFKASLIENWELCQRVSLHDWYCYAYARHHGFRWFIDSTSSMHYRQHAANQVGANTGISAFTGRLKKITGGWWPEQVLLINRLIGDTPPLALNEKSDFLRLIFMAGHCRRRRRDKLLFIIACLAAAASKKEPA